MNKKIIASVPIYFSKESPQLVGFIERDDIRHLLVDESFLLNPSRTVREFFSKMVRLWQKQKLSSEDIAEQQNEDD